MGTSLDGRVSEGLFFPTASHALFTPLLSPHSFSTDPLLAFPVHLRAATSRHFPQPGFLSGRVYLYKKC